MYETARLAATTGTEESKNGKSLGRENRKILKIILIKRLLSDHPINRNTKTILYNWGNLRWVLSSSPVSTFILQATDQTKSKYSIKYQ